MHPSQHDFVIRENPRLYALLERYPWVLLTPPVPPRRQGLGLGASDPDGDPVMFRP
jgi:hypothetical protein